MHECKCGFKIINYIQLYHTHYTISEQNNKVNLFPKMQKAFILINDVKQLSNLMTLASSFAFKKSDKRP